MNAQRLWAASAGPVYTQGRCRGRPRPLEADTHGRRPGVVVLWLGLIALVALLSAVWWPNTGTETANGPRLPWGLAEKRLALRLADDVLLASQALASERKLALAALSALEPIGAPEASAVAERSKGADGAVARVQVLLKHLQPSPVARHLERVAAAQAMVLSQRQEFDRDAGKPAVLRSIHTVSRSFETSTALIAAMQDLLGTIHAELKAADNAIAGWLEVQRLSPKWQNMPDASARKSAFSSLLPVARPGGN